LLVQRCQPSDGICLGLVHLFCAVAFGVFAAVQGLFEEAVIARNQRHHLVERALRGSEPAVRVIGAQRVQHDLQALLQHFAILQHQHRHGAFGRGIQQRLWLAAQVDFSQLARQPRMGQCQTRTHGVRAAAKGIQNEQGKSLAHGSISA